MPFKSKAQQGFLESSLPKVAAKFAAKTPKSAYKSLPPKVGSSPKRKSPAPPAHGYNRGAAIKAVRKFYQVPKGQSMDGC